MLTILITALLVALSVSTHYEGLRLLSNAVESVRIAPRRRMLLILYGVVAIHLLEIAFYAAAYWFGATVVNVGTFTGERGMQGVDLLDYFYFSAETYTSLGIGDAYPVGDLRLIASIEALVGLLLIGWSTSFTYIAMTKYWQSHTPTAPP